MIINITGIPRERNNLKIYPAPYNNITTNIPIISSSPSTSSAHPINLTSNSKLPIFRRPINIENIKSTSINPENIHPVTKKAPSPSKNAVKKYNMELNINK